MTSTQKRFLLALFFLGWTIACLSAGTLVGAGVNLTHHRIEFGWPTCLSPRAGP